MTVVTDAGVAVAESDVEQLAGMLAHELRNPLASAATNLAVAADLCEDADPRTPFLKRAEHEMDRIGDLLRACLDLACAGRVHVRELGLRQLLGSLARSLSDESIVVELEVSDDLRASVDPILIGRSIENLVENARRALAEVAVEQRRVRISAGVAAGELCIAVDDSGPGLSPELAARVFEPFVKGSRSTGLGLAIVRKIAVAHGGIASVEKSPLGGARFEMRFPLRDSTES